MAAFGGAAYGGAAYMPVTAQSSFSGTMPYSIITEIAFASNPLDDATAVWTDVSKYVQSIQTNRGRQHELNRFEAGTATIALDNKDGRFSPFNTSSPYNPNVLPYKQVRVRALYNGVYYPIFRGHINSWPVKWPSPADSTVAVQATDATKILNLKTSGTLGSYASTILSDGPAVYYRLGDVPNPASVSDSSGHGRVGVLLSGAPGSLASVPLPNSYLPSTFGAAGAIVADTDTAFDAGGFAADITITNLSLSGAGPYSIEAWVLVRSTLPASSIPILSFQNAAGSQLMVLGVSYTGNVTGNNEPAGSVVFEILDTITPGFTNPSSFAGTSDVRDGKYHHVVLTASSNGKTYNLYVDGVNQQSMNLTTAPNFSTLNVAVVGEIDGLVDEFAFYTATLTQAQVSAHYLAATQPLSGQTTGARITSILNGIGWPSSLRKLDAGLITVQPGTNDLVTKTALANIQAASDTELGELFIGADGSVVFFDHAHKYKTPNGLPAVVLGDSGTVGPGGESPYLIDSVDIEFDDLDLYNQVSVTPAGQGAQIVSDTASQTVYGPRTLSQAGIHELTSDAVNEASWLVNKFKTPLQRIRSITFTPMSDPTVLLPAAMGFELLTRITVKRRPKDGAGSMFAQDSLIEGISHKITPGYWETSWALSPTDASPVMWIIDDPVAGKVVDGAAQSPPVGIGF